MSLIQQNKKKIIMPSSIRRKLSKTKKWNRVKRTMLSRKKFLRMNVYSKIKVGKIYLKDLQISIPKRFPLSMMFIYMYLVKIRLLLRNLYGKLKEKQLGRIHRWF